jgi:hypothetical protein
MSIAQDIPTIANMLLLKPFEAEELRALGPIEWLLTRTEVEREFHFLPSLSTVDCSRFVAFFDARQELIRSSLKSMFGPVPLRKPDAEESQLVSTNERVASAQA